MKLILLGTYINTLTRDFHVSDTTKKQSKRAGQLKKKHPARNSETTQTGKPLFLYKDLIDRHRHSKP